MGYAYDGWRWLSHCEHGDSTAKRSVEFCGGAAPLSLRWGLRHSWRGGRPPGCWAAKLAANSYFVSAAATRGGASAGLQFWFGGGVLTSEGVVCCFGVETESTCAAALVAGSRNRIDVRAALVAEIRNSRRACGARCRNQKSTSGGGHTPSSAAALSQECRGGAVWEREAGDSSSAMGT
jgi:hypothetical protein